MNPFVDHSIKLALEDHRSSGNRPLGKNLHSIPYPSFFHWSKGTSNADLPWLQRGNRQYLFSLVGGGHDTRGDGSMGLRSMLLDLCLGRKDLCHFVNISAFSEEQQKHGDFARAIIEAYRRSVFSLQPLGDSPTRKGMVDSIMFGCIPVLFAKAK